MARKVYIDVIVDDKGTTKRLAVDANKLQESLQKTGKSAQTADRRLKGAAQASSNSTKNFSKMAQGISGGLVPAYATLAANVFAVSAAFNFLKNAADLRVLQDSQVAFSSATGQGMKSLTKDIQTAARGLLSFQDAAQAASIGIASGLSASQVEELAKGAANVSQILGRDVTDSFNRLVRGVTKAEPELLDELGVTLRLADATEAYAATLGKRANQLTNFERKQAVFNDVQAQLESKFNKVADAADIQANAIDKLGKAFDEVLNNVKEFSAFLLEPVAEFFANNIRSLTIALGLFAVPIIKQIIPGLDDWAKTSKKASDATIKSYNDAQKELEQIAIAQKKITDPQAALQSAVSGVKSKSTGIKALQEGQQLSERQRKSLLRAAQEGKGVITQLSKDQQRVYIAALRAMGNENKKFGFSVRRTWEGIAAAGKKASKTVEVAWKGAMASMSKATAGFAKFTDKAFRAAGVIGIVLLFVDLVKEALDYLGLFQKDPALVKIEEQVRDLTERLKENNKEFEKFADIAKSQQSNGGIAIENFQALGNMLSTITDNLLEMNSALLASAVASSKISKVAGGQMNRRRGPSNFGLGGLPTAPQAGPQVLKLTDIQKEGGEAAVEVLKKLNQGLEATGITSLSTGKELQTLTLRFIEQGKLTEKDAKRFAELSNQVQVYGDLATKVVQAEGDLDTSYSKSISSLTNYQSSYSDLIREEEAQIERLKELAVVEGDVAGRLEKRTKQLSILKALKELEYKKDLDSANLQLTFLKNSRFLSKNQKENLELARQRVDIDNQIGFIRAQTAALEKAGVKVDDERYKLLQLQLGILEQQKATIDDQLNATTRLGMEMKNAFESGFQTGLAGLIKNEETSFKKIIFGIAENTLKAGADSLARTITDKFMNKLFKKQTPEDKMKNAIVQGATEGAAVLKDAVRAGVTDTPIDPESLIGTAAQVGTTNLGTPVVDPSLVVKKAAGPFGDALGALGSSIKQVFVPRKEKVSIEEGGDIIETEQVTSLPKRLGNVFMNFTEVVGSIFSKDSDFLGGLGSIFTQGLSGLGGLFTSLFQGIGGGGGIAGLFTGIVGSIFGARYGGVMQGYATGGIARGRNAGYPAILHGTEAVVPLPNGNSIPVEMRNGGAVGTNNVTVNVSVDQNGNAQSNTQMDNQQAGALGKAISAAVQEELQRQKRPGGMLSPYGAA